MKLGVGYVSWAGFVSLSTFRTYRCFPSHSEEKPNKKQVSQTQLTVTLTLVYTTQSNTHRKSTGCFSGFHGLNRNRYTMCLTQFNREARVSWSELGTEPKQGNWYTTCLTQFNREGGVSWSDSGLNRNRETGIPYMFNTVQ